MQYLGLAVGRYSPICAEWTGFAVFSGISACCAGAGAAKTPTSGPIATSSLATAVTDVVAEASVCCVWHSGPFLPFAVGVCEHHGAKMGAEG